MVGRYHQCDSGYIVVTPVRNLLSLKNSMDSVALLIAAAAFVAVLQSFIIGRHYIIPTAILCLAVLFGNLARYGFQGQRWAKHILFWLGSILTLHFFFALFWSKRYREWLGDAFEPVCGVLVLLLAFLVFQYAKKNELFR